MEAKVGADRLLCLFSCQLQLLLNGICVQLFTHGKQGRNS
jgi:hypothetical protein